MKDLKKFYECCNIIVKNRKEKSLNYAVAYAEYGRTIQNREEAIVQALYIRNNIIYWRGPEAKKVRSFLKEFSQN